MDRGTASGLLIANQSAAATFKTIDFPGASLTALEGVGPGGHIVGFYNDAGGHQHGFLLAGGSFTSIDYPGAVATDARGIGPDGDIVGTFLNAPGGPVNLHGYLLSHGTFLALTDQAQGYPGMIPQRITPTGDIYGCVHIVDFGANMRGFVRDAAGNYTVFSVPSSMHQGATPDGSVIAGLYNDLSTGRTHGYLVVNGDFEPFDVPNSNLTQSWDINVRKEVVGQFRDLKGGVHGFLLSGPGGVFTTIDVSGARGTAARGITPRGDIVGWYIDSMGHQHGFLRSVAGSD
ncbi:MAG TPA: hypothetical protein VNA31_02365 [bacterium]|nr:hypothetical protein [bacterium]